MTIVDLGLEPSEADSRTHAHSALLEGTEPTGYLWPNSVPSQRQPSGNVQLGFIFILFPISLE